MRKIHRFSAQAAFVGLLAIGSGVAAHAAPACEPDKAAAKYPTLASTTVKVATDGESPPFSQRDPADLNKLIGLDADLTRAVFACAGVKMDFTVGGWSGLIPATVNGQTDVMWDSLLYTPDRAKQLDFVAYMNAATGMLVAKNNPKGIKALDDLCGLQATAGLGTTQEVMLKGASDKCVAAGKKPVEIITSADIPAGARLVQSGRVDLFTTNKFLVEAFAASNPEVEEAFSIKTDAILAVGVTKNKPELVELIADGLTALQSTGELKAIFDKDHIDYSLAMTPQILTK